MTQLLATPGQSDSTPREQRALALCNIIKWRKQRIANEFVGLGLDLLEMYEKQYWNELGYDNFSMLLASPEIDLSSTMGYDLVRIGRLVLQGFFPVQEMGQIGLSKMRLFLPIAENPPNDKQEWGEWVEKAKSLTWDDFRREVRGDDDYEAARYSGRGMLAEVVEDMRKHPELWEREVQVRVRTL